MLEINPYLAGECTNADLSRWVQQSVDFTAQQGNCVVIEGTLREPEVNIRTASQYIKHGFTAHLHLLAVHEFVSRTRIFRRHFDQNDENSSYGRYTPREAHDRSYKVLPKSVLAIINSSSFKTVTLYDQNQTPIHVFNLPEPDAGKDVLAVFEKCRDNKCVDIVRILLEIDDLIPKAKEHGRIYSDLQELRENVLSSNEKYFIPNAPLFGTKELDALGCEYDSETDQWYHTDPDKIKQAVQVVIEAREHADMGTQAESNEGYKNWYEPGTVRRPENKQADMGTQASSPAQSNEGYKNRYDENFQMKPKMEWESTNEPRIAAREIGRNATDNEITLTDIKKAFGSHIIIGTMPDYSKSSARMEM